MGLRFILRGTSLDAHFSYAGKTSAPFGNIADDPAVTANANSGVFGTSVIDFVPASVTKGLIFPGRENVCASSNTGAFSVLARIVPTTTASPFVGFGVCEVGSSRNPYGYAYRCGINSSGKAYLQLADLAGNLTTYTGSTTINSTANVPFDIMFTWDGTSGAGKIKVSKDGVEIESITSTNSVSGGRVMKAMSNIVVGSISAGPTSTRANLNELIIWDSQETHTYSARTDFWSQAAFDGASYSDPGIANVKTATSYTYAGASQTGTYDGSDRWTDPGASNVKTGTAYKANSTTNNQTGTYDGSDRWTDPGEANVRSGTAYKANSTTNNKTGTAAIPVAANVRSGTATDATTGTLDLPTEANVKTGITYDGASKTGTYEGTDRYTDPGIANVAEGVAYKFNSTTNNRTGTLETGTQVIISNVSLEGTHNTATLKAGNT